MSEEQIKYDFLDEILPMITEEIAVAQKEGDKTSRLTSLYNRLSDIQFKIGETSDIKKILFGLLELISDDIKDENVEAVNEIEKTIIKL